ncbi:hypothetical protein A6R68_22172, partial [Neotoma lepida]
RYPDCRCLNFGSWFLFSFPVAIILLLLSWIWLQWLFLGFNVKEMFKCGKTKTLKEKACAEVIKQEYEKLGPIRYQEIVTLVIFILMALLWFSRDPGFVTVAFDYSPLITWKEFQSFMPWDIAILVGGGFALADGC